MEPRPDVVLLITDDADLAGAVAQSRPLDAPLRVLSRAQADTDPDPVRQCWVDLAGAGDLNLPEAERYVYFYCHTDAPATKPAHPGVFLQKPCSEQLLRTLWERVADSDRREDAPAPADGTPLPAWVLDYHELSLTELSQRLVRRLPGRLGYRHASLYLTDPANDSLRLADCSHDRPVALAVDANESDGALIRSAIRKGEPLVGPSDGVPPAQATASYRDGAYLVAPLTAGGRVLGVLNCCERLIEAEPTDAVPLPVVLRFISAALQHALDYERALTEARVDGLTGLYNYRWMIDALEREVQRARRFDAPLSVIVVDLDGLKTVNDQYGHLTGDQLLQHVGRTIRAGLRRFDSAARIGGDEFVVALPATNVAGAEQAARRILTDLRSEVAVYDDTPLKVSASMGIAQWRPDWSVKDLLSAADEAMYRAKRHGREPQPAGRPRSALQELVACTVDLSPPKPVVRR